MQIAGLQICYKTYFYKDRKRNRKEEHIIIFHAGAMRARYNYSYNYSYGKENGDLQSGKQ
mgnify:FL=1